MTVVWDRRVIVTGPDFESIGFTPSASVAEHLAAIVESSDDAIIGKTLDGIITAWNAGAQRLYGYSAQEAIGRPISVLVPSEQPDELPGIMARLRRGERIDHFETQRVRKDGTRVHVSVTISPVRNERGEVVGASAIARDISERRRLEKERARLLELERQARHEAERANLAKDQFLAMVSHELRTPLNAVAGWLHILRSKRDDPVLVDRALDTAERNIRLLAKVVDDLLDISGILAGRVTMNRQPIEIIPTLETALDSLRPTAAEKCVELESTVDPWAGPILADAERLQQIIGNIAGNALKFTPSGGRIHVQVWNDSTHVVISVSDTGQGIPREFLPYLFEPFQQAAKGSARAHGGLGLGLAIVRHLVELHDGTVEGESGGVGKGARITVRLPLLKDPLIRGRLL
jgi:PAS domain S-box-containing protein